MNFFLYRLLSQLNRRIGVFTLGILSLSLLLTSETHAHPSSPPTPASFTTSVSGDLNGLHDLYDQGSTAERSRNQYRNIVSLELSANLFSLGLSRIRFERIVPRTWIRFLSDGKMSTRDGSEIVLLRGEIIDGDGARYQHAASIFEENGVATLHLSFSGKDEENLYSASIPLDRSNSDSAIAAVSVIPASSIAGGRCGSEHTRLRPEEESKSDPIPLNSAIREVEIATDADYEYFQAYGSNTNNWIASFINSANVAYERDLGIRLVLVRQNVWTTTISPYPFANDGESLRMLNAFTDAGNLTRYLGHADLYHLFSGKALVGGVAGRAWFGALCASPSTSYGITYRFAENNDFVVMAHELGHNMAAWHDDSGLSIMNTQANFAARSFLNQTQSEVGNHLSRSGGCTNFSGPTPVPSPSPTPSASLVPPTPCRPDGLSNCLPVPPPTESPTPTPTATRTPAPTPTRTPTVAPTLTPTPPLTPSPSKTPVPTASPVPTLESTPTPMPSRPIAPGLNLALEVEDSQFRGSIIYPSNDSSCSVSLQGSRFSSFRNRSSVKLVRRIAFDNSSHVFAGSSLAGAVRTTRSSGRRAYFRAVLGCKGQSEQYSNIVSITVKETADRRAKLISSWISALLRQARR